nr:MAG TPA: hypothetical protein [Caudoviricetes sp.]
MPSSHYEFLVHKFDSFAVLPINITTYDNNFVLSF